MNTIVLLQGCIFFPRESFAEPRLLVGFAILHQQIQ